ncbi:MAG: peptidylprolyl isomerase, partial [Gammaproteobacteria bacterium]|nr:peptidylprolyl isomerase [Gammaproteobacteria bacterium]
LASQKVPLPPAEVLKRQVMERMAIERLQLQVARLNNIKASDEQIDLAIRKISEQNHKSPEQLRHEAEKEPGGVRAFREELRTQIILQQLLEREINNRIFVSDKEVESFLASQAGHGDGTEYNISHILIALPEAAKTETINAVRATAEQVLAQLRKGADFGQMAAAHSQGQNALEGGNIGWKSSGQLPDLFVEALRKLQPGETSDVLRSPNGFHILRLVARRGGTQAVQVTQTHARHILVKVSEVVPLREAKRRIEQLRERIQNGADFSEMARTNSDDLGSAANGGDLGWANPGVMVPEFEKAMNALKPGALSEPVITPFGVHLIQVLERRQRDVGPEREAANARSQIHARKADERYEQWLRQLRDDAYVEIRSDDDK